MNPEPLENVSAKVESVAWKIIKWLAGSVLIIAFLGGIFWLLFYSNIFANDPLFTPLRNWYQDTYWAVQKYLSPSQSNQVNLTPIYNLQQQEPIQNGVNTYTFTGKFSRIDTAKRYIYLTDNNGEEYMFDVRNFILIDTKNTWLKLYLVDNTKNLSTGITPESTTPGVDDEKLLTQAKTIAVIDNQLAVSPGSIVIRWSDERNLSQIEQQRLQDPLNPLNAAQPESTVVMGLSLPTSQAR